MVMTTNFRSVEGPDEREGQCGKSAQQPVCRRSTFGVESFVKRACLFRGVCDAIGGLQVDIALERCHIVALPLLGSEH